MTVLYKSSVRHPGAHRPELEHAIREAGLVYEAFGHDCWVTSLKDSHEHNMNSEHHDGLAADFRIRNLRSDEMADVADQVADVAREVQRRLGTAYWVALHPVNEPNHLHVQYQRTSG